MGTREGRAVGGKSSGGFGALVLAMRHPELFAAVASHAGGMAFELSTLMDLPTAARTLRRHGGVEAFVAHFEKQEKKSGDDFTTMMVLAEAAAYVPEPGRPAGAALPFDIETGEIDWAVWKRWMAWDPIEMAAAHAEALRRMRLIYLDAGTRDEHDLDLGARIFVKRLAALGIACEHEEFDDGHRATAYRYDISLPKLAAAIGAPPVALRSAVDIGGRLEITCTDLDDSGAGLGEIDGRRVHVAGALPGERVAAIVEHVSRQSPAAWARLVSIEAPSTERRPPACPAFGACGGCVLQHLAYDAQLDWKRRRVVESFADANLVGAGRRHDRSLRPLAAAARIPEQVEAGRRAERRWPRAGARGLRLPLARGRRSRRLPDCRATARRDGGRAAGDPRRSGGASVRRTNVDRQLAPRRPPLQPRRRGAGRLDHRPSAPRWRRVGAPFSRRPPRGRWRRGTREPVARQRDLLRCRRHDRTHPRRRRQLEDQIALDGRVVRLKLSPGAFFQANREVAALAYAAIDRGLAPRPTDRIVDAYSRRRRHRPRAGTARCGDHRRRIARGRRRRCHRLGRANGIPNARFVAGDAAPALAAIDRADLVVLNPPRKGCAPEVLRQVVRLAPRAVAYLSCDPDTLARDLGLLAAHGYRSDRVTPFDMLPHTTHVEALAIASRYVV